VLSPDDQANRAAAEEAVAQALEELLRDADRVQVTDVGNGLQTFSAAFDRTKLPPSDS